MANDDISVRVAVRVRPQVASEVIDMCRVCTRATPGEPQLTLGADKSFTFDYVFDTEATQADLYDACVAPLVRGALDGYNATVLAYGQTGSGKTYTMGTGFEAETVEETRGVVPRALRDLFTGITERCDGARAVGQLPPEFAVSAQFLELYNEEIVDLFDPTSSHYNAKDWSGTRLRIVEDVAGGVRVAGAACQTVRDAPAALACLRLGALARTTAATNMNAASSRSHAVFTLHVKQQRLVRNEDPDADMDTTMDPTTEFETLSAKFHFVDLAGSERLKRTGATGERAREGISINCGLLALGNVISALGDKSRRVTHVPYRDSKLTRLLQDSLGGNSQTVMIACVSPSDRDFMETLNTLKYANRARNIKNRIVVNQDKSSRTILLLRQEIAQLQLELLEFKQGKRIVSENGEDGINDMFHENQVLQSELNNLRMRVKAMQSTIEQLSERNSQLLAERALGSWTHNGENTPECNLTDLVQGYVKEIEGLRAKLLEADHVQQSLRRNLQQRQTNAMSKSFTLSGDAAMLDSSTAVLSEAKRELYREKELLARSVGELEFHRKLSHGAAELTEMGERERAEGESADDSDRSEEESDSEDDTDSEAKVCAALGAELASLSGDIDTKQRLIEELERSQRQLHSMRRHYEDKLLALHSKIKLTQEERDKVLASYGAQPSAPSDKVRRVREEYERRLGELQREVRRLQSAQREHTRLLRDHSATEAHIRSVKNELAEMKRAKVKLLNKMKEESLRHKQAETRRNREIAQLRKESRKNANVIRNLEAEKRLKEQVLRRKTEEVTALRRGTKQNKLSEKAAGRKIDNYSLKTAKHKWQILEKTLRSTALRKQAIGDMEHDMERQLAERERLGHELERLRSVRTHATAAGRDLADVDNEIDTVKSNIDYLQESIAEAQHHIMQFEESKEGGDESQVQSVLGGIRNVAEARYLIDKLYNISVTHMYTASQKDLQLKDSQAKIHEMELCSEEKEKMLRTVMYEGGYVAPPLDSPVTSPRVLPVTKFSEISSGTSTRSVSPVDSTLIELRNDAKNLSKNYPWLETSPPASEPTSATNSERSPFQRNSTNRGSVRLREIGVVGSEERADIMTQSLSEAPHTGQPLAKVPSAPGSLKGLVPLKQYSIASPLLVRRSPAEAAPRPAPRTPELPPAPVRAAPRTPELPPASPRLVRRTLSLTGPPPHPLLGRPGSMERLEESGSPPVSRRMYDDVFCRLAANITSEPTLTGGLIKQYTGKWSQRAALQCTHVAEGHTNAVLSLCATDRLLISASADRTVKVWDLERGTERDTLAAHPHSVVCVRYEPTSGLLFSVSGAYVRVHDLRCSPHSYIKTLCSSGATQSGNWAVGRGLTLPTGECSITDAVLNPAATLLYTTANDKLRIWDTRRLECVGKISSGHQAAIMCLTVGSTPENDDIVITGSKDHYVKVVEVRGGVSALTSTTRCLLEPPHYDGVQCLALLGNTLFSGSRDMSIKKWNLNTQELVHSVNGAHKGWVTGLCTWGDSVVVSCGRGGRLRVWDAAATNASRSLAHAHIDDSLNAVATNATHIFTAANDGKVRVWSYSSKPRLASR